MFLDWFTIQYTRFGTIPCIKLYPTIACEVCKSGYCKPNTIASYAMKMFRIEFKGLYFGTHRNEFNCVFGSKQLRNYAALSRAMGIRLFPFLSLQMLGGRLCRSFQSCKHLRCSPCTANQSSISLGVTAAAYQKNVNHCYRGHTNSDRFLHGKRYPIISGLQIRMHYEKNDFVIFNQNLCCGYAIEQSQ